MKTIQDFLSRIKAWAEQQGNISGVFLVGSYARGTARADSDVDLVILTSRPEGYLDAISFAENFGAIEKLFLIGMANWVGCKKFTTSHKGSKDTKKIILLRDDYAQPRA